MDPSNREKRAKLSEAKIMLSTTTAAYHLSLSILDKRKKNAEMIGRPPLKAEPTKWAIKTQRRCERVFVHQQQTFFEMLVSPSHLIARSSSIWMSCFLFLPNRLVFSRHVRQWRGKPSSSDPLTWEMLDFSKFCFPSVRYVYCLFLFKMQTLFYKVRLLIRATRSWISKAQRISQIKKKRKSWKYCV